MCFGNKDSSNDPPPKPAQIPQPSSTSSSHPKASMPHQYAPPSGPPPSHGHAPPSEPPSHDYAPPPGPPPSKNNPFNDYAPPSGPSPQNYAPPAGPPPNDKKQQGHDWESAVPDTSLLPPPPNFFGGFERSPTNNATEAECEEGEQFCRKNPFYPLLTLDQNALTAVQSGNINMFTPPSYQGTLNRLDVGVWKGTTSSQLKDTCFASYPPLYNVAAHSPVATGRKKTIYYEVHILQDSRREVSLALGYFVAPYPSFRLPGWHRGSVGVHGDDGHKYINDRWGGKDFTQPFKRGEVLGLGMDFHPGVGGGIIVEIFFTRNGVESGRWNLHEETDREQDLPVTGLEGFHDVCASVGMFEKVSFEIVFAPQKWVWKGYQE